MHWPVGTLRNQFIPSGRGATLPPRPGKVPATSSLRSIRRSSGRTRSSFTGFNMDGFRGQGGGHEDGTPFATTGASSPGTRANGGETDDGCAGGPSWDQILLKNVPGSRKERRGHDHRSGLLQHDLRQAHRLLRDIRRAASRTATKNSSSVRALAANDPGEQPPLADTEPAARRTTTSSAASCRAERCRHARRSSCSSSERAFSTTRLRELDRS